MKQIQYSIFLCLFITSCAHKNSSDTSPRDIANADYTPCGKDAFKVGHKIKFLGLESLGNKSSAIFDNNKNDSQTRPVLIQFSSSCRGSMEVPGSTTFEMSVGSTYEIVMFGYGITGRSTFLRTADGKKIIMFCGKDDLREVFAHAVENCPSKAEKINYQPSDSTETPVDI
ncbi:MAG: hypothetical protein H6623_07335 [Bdellovibrionaceae bacterium]|nr:hypothetical protein [Pseudobdellovibrionaceae bacterium]